MTSTNKMRSEFYISFVMLLETHYYFTRSATQDKYNYKKIYLIISLKQSHHKM